MQLEAGHDTHVFEHVERASFDAELGLQLACRVKRHSDVDLVSLSFSHKRLQFGVLYCPYEYMVSWYMSTKEP